ncbi:GNAT family N-acetyltransferase [Luedemannella helvata]|uniref:GNAT family N-acetyltransferase n=1 Tax=Luedemannella helvata TaxID=349315 RepID=A0ABN2KG87_9ACTN
MTVVRRAGPDDAEELTRLRVVMWAALDGIAPVPGPWYPATVARFRETLADPDSAWAAFVVDKDDTGLASCAVGTIERRLPNPGNLTGETGHIFNVATDPAYRRRGYSRACMTALLTWYAERGVTKVELNASPYGEPLYQQLGFARHSMPAMRRSLAPRPANGPGRPPT